MSCFRKDYNEIAEAIITEAVVLDSTDISEGEPLPKYVYTDNAVWDTGAEATIISIEIVKTLGLAPVGHVSISGVGGDQSGNTYIIQLVLPNKDVIHNLKIISSDLEDYDILIGMDVITKTDFLISSKDTTVFSFRYPSEGNAEIK